MVLVSPFSIKNQSACDEGLHHPKILVQDRDIRVCTGAQPALRFQFERLGYFCTDPDSTDQTASKLERLGGATLEFSRDGYRLYRIAGP